jgi:hypothetical protein
VPIDQLGHGRQYVPTLPTRRQPPRCLYRWIVSARQPVVRVTMASNAVQPALELQILRICTVADHALDVTAS